MTDEELVARARTGDREAFGELVTRHQPAVIGVLLSMQRDLSLAEDAAQAAFVKAYRSLGSFEGRSSFRTWVTRIALNAARSQRRWARLRGWFSADETELAEAPVREAAGETGMEAVDRRLELERAMRALAPREREVVALRLEGYALAEIAETLSISEGTVKSTLSSAGRKMRGSLA